VWRVYDNRLADTERRPDVYIILKAGEELCNLPDGKHPLFPFGQRGDGCDDRDRLWLFRGCCAVYVTLYREGKHVAWSALDLIPPVNRLLEFHKLGLVHGDIRCCNIIFGPTGDLIDYDFGGEIDRADPTKSPKYPCGYRGYDIPDGFRRGREGGTITMRDDWAAMFCVIFEKHLVAPPANVRGECAEDELNIMRFMQLTDDKNDLTKFFLGDGPDDVGAIEVCAAALVRFLRSAHAAGWTVRPHPILVPTLELWGLDVAPPPPHEGTGDGGN
jgi:serine/threonine protein kinase